LIFKLNKKADIFIYLVFLFLIIQSLLMGLNREHGNDLDTFMHLSTLFFGGERIGSSSIGMISSLFPLFFFFVLSNIPTALAHAIWYPMLSLLFIHSNKTFHKAIFGKEIASVPFLIVFVIFIEIIQSNFLNGRMHILVMALILYSLAELRCGSSNKAIIFLALAVSLKVEASLFLFHFLFSKKYLTFLKTILAIFLFTFLLPFIFNGVGTTSFYLYFYGWLANRIFDSSAMLYSLPLLLIICVAFLSTIFIHLWLAKNEKGFSCVELLYFPLLLIVFHPLFSTHSLIFLFPPLFIMTSHLWEYRSRLWRLKSFYLLLLTAGIYHIARVLDDPKSAYLLAVISLLASILVYIKEELEKSRAN